MNRVVNLTKRVKTPRGLRYCPVALSENGRVKPDVVIGNGNEEKHPEGGYYLDWTEGSKRVRGQSARTHKTQPLRASARQPNSPRKGNGIAVVPENGRRSREFNCSACRKKNNRKTPSST
ncbi:MAG TPA: hypothetical protein VMQ17_12555 [Candidatus Sulfotelmatobacter sp.]|nr:hypothetical protein [Candidatus Sulfotelmatobacter sp.]